MPDNWNLFLAGDPQWGNVSTYEKGVDSLFHAVNSEYRGCSFNRVAWMGDTIDCIDVKDKRFSFSETKQALIRHQRDHAVERLKAIQGQLLIGLQGNHEYKIMNTYGDISEEIYQSLGCRYGGYVCVPTLLDDFGRVQFRAFLHHGFGKLNSNAKDWVQFEANIRASLKQRLQHLFSGAALMAMGHTHKLIVVEPDPSLQIVTDDRGELTQIYRHTDERAYIDHSAIVVPEQYRWYCNTGSFLKIYDEGMDGYVARAGMRPVELGYLVATIRNNRLTKVYKETV